jgi:hypothetical protein
VSSTFPEGLIYEEKNVRTLFLNKVISKILPIAGVSEEIKKRKHTNFGVLSRGVGIIA